MYDGRAHHYSKAIQNQYMREAEHERLVKDATAGQPSFMEVVTTKLTSFFARRPVTTAPVRGTN